ncbi:helix-turn-helix domain-containing protein [Geomonas propionica]|uniref:DNA-binding transcriptional regulator n=1 Tax=Geomonas propionica TaxID=2798582 RepID=A0ABS0YWM5_9BACT|nr:DNA-binding transcriptional regulator [Geomonas propionica]MBJ6802381.1 DNA-binding transcriptional regulator [Geomonas propionica]
MSEILDIANEMAEELFEAGMMDDITFREIQALCLPRKKPFKPEDIKRIRTACHVSQAVFAAFLGIGKSTVQQWEQGLKKPSGPAVRLLDIVERKGLAALR